MNLENAKATFGLTARSEMTAPGTSSSDRQLLGVPASELTFADADIFYSFKLTASGIAQNSQLDLEDGTLTGSPANVGGDGLDFEGVSLPTMVTFYALCIETPASNTTDVAATFDLNDAYANAGVTYLVSGIKNKHLLVHADGVSVNSSDSLILTFMSAGATATVTIIGKSS